MRFYGSVIFFVTRDGKQIDEYEKHEFHSKIFSGEIMSTDHYWIEGLEDWRPVSEYTVAMPTMKMQVTPVEESNRSASTEKTGPRKTNPLARMTDWLRRRH